MNNQFERKIILNKINNDSLKINERKLYKDFSFIKLSTKCDPNVKYYNFKSLLLGDTEFEKLLCDNIASVLNVGCYDFYIMLTKKDEYLTSKIIDKILENAKLLSGFETLSVRETNDFANKEYILLNLLLNYIPKLNNDESFLNASGKCSYFLEEIKKEQKIRFLEFLFNEENVFINSVSSYLVASHYFKNTKDADFIKNKQSIYNIRRTFSGYVIEVTSSKKEDFHNKEHLYVNRSYLTKGIRHGKASIKTHSFSISESPEKNKIIEKVLNDFYDYFSEYVSFDFLNLKEQDYKCYTVDSLKKETEQEENMIKNILKDKEIVFIDAINSESSKKWINEQIDMLVKGKMTNVKGNEIERDIFGKEKNEMFLLNRDNIHVCEYDDSLKNKDTYYILVTLDKDDYKNKKDPYIKSHLGYTIQTQNLKTSLSNAGYEKMKKNKNKGITLENTLENYKLDINKDILRQTLFSLIIEEQLNLSRTCFSYSDDITFYKQFKIEKEKEKRAEEKYDEYYVTVRINSNGTLEKSVEKSTSKLNDTNQIIYTIYQSYYNNSNSIECIIGWKGNLYIVLKSKLSALPDYKLIKELKLKGEYMAPSKDGKERSKKNINRAKHIVSSVWGGYYDVHTFFINNKFCFLPSPLSSKNVVASIQNAPVGRYIVPYGINLSKADAKDLFDVLSKDFGSRFLNNLRFPSLFFGNKLLSEYFEHYSRENNLQKSEIYKQKTTI